MTQHIEEARKVWGYFKGGSAGGTEAMQWFDNNKSCGGPAYLIEVFRAALAAAEERGRIEERERCVAVFDRLLRQLVELDRFSRSYALRLTSLAKADCATITKEPTP